MDKSLLHDEHTLLGATMHEGADDRSMPHAYLNTDAEQAFSSGCALIDMTGLGSRLMCGADVERFVCSAFAGKVLSVGEIAPEAVLTGDGALASVCLLARTGNAEYAAWDLLGRGDILFAWLEFVSGIEQNGARAFEDVSMEDASEALVPLMLCGPKAADILADYLREQELPESGNITGVSLDDIGCLLGAISFAGEKSYLVLVPPRFARILWRSFLSFTMVAPVSPHELVKHVIELIGCLDSKPMNTERIAIDGPRFAEASLIRKDQSFVGARALYNL